MSGKGIGSSEWCASFSQPAGRIGQEESVEAFSVEIVEFMVHAELFLRSSSSHEHLAPLF